MIVFKGCKQGCPKAAGSGGGPRPLKRQRKDDAAAHPNDNLKAEIYIKDDLTSAGVDPAQIDKWVNYTVRTVTAHVKLISAENMSEGQLASAIVASPLGSLRGLAGATYIGVLCDPKLSGEAVTAPHIRVPPFRQDQITHLLGAATQARGTTGVVAAGDVYFIPDGGKHGLSAKASMGTCFKDAESKKVKNMSKTYYILYDQASLMSRRRATRTCTSLHQIEFMSVFTSSNLVLPRKRRAVYNEMALTNEADTIGPVRWPLWSTSWTMTFGKKKDLFTPENRPAVGGLTDAAQPEEEENDNEEEDGHAMQIDSTLLNMPPPLRQPHPGGIVSCCW